MATKLERAMERLESRMATAEMRQTLMERWQEQQIEMKQETERAIEGLRMAGLEVARAAEALLSVATASPITASPTEDNQWAAAASTTPTTPASSQSGQSTIASGRVEQGSGCAHEWEQFWLTEMFGDRDMFRGRWCNKCGALMYSGKILVPAAAQQPSTSVKPDSESSVASSGTTAPSVSKSSDECHHVWWPIDGISGKNWDTETNGPLIEFCRYDCGAIRQNITGNNVVMVPA